MQRADGDAKPRMRFVLDYPEEGPADIYALGVPRSAKVVDRVPKPDCPRADGVGAAASVLPTRTTRLSPRHMTSGRHEGGGRRHVCIRCGARGIAGASSRGVHATARPPMRPRLCRRSARRRRRQDGVVERALEGLRFSAVERLRREGDLRPEAGPPRHAGKGGRTSFGRLGPSQAR